MSYKSWFDAHASKHAKLIEKLLLLGYGKEQIIEYFDFENMRISEEDFCPLYTQNKKCHEMDALSCYLCACPNFRFSDNGIGEKDGTKVYSECAIASKDGAQENFGGKIHQNCAGCTVPHEKEFVREKFDMDWKKIMKECETGNICVIQGDIAFLEALKGKSANFVLSGGYTKTAEIEGITVAGLPGFIAYTPALDMEVLELGYPKSMPDIAKAPDGPPSPVLIAMASKELAPFGLTFVDTGLTVKPQCTVKTPGFECANSILDGANVNAKALFDEGVKFADEIVDKADYFILSECVPAGTTTAYAVTKALGYECDGAFASSGADTGVKTLKQEVVAKALGREPFDASDVFGVISRFGDTMQPFTAGLAVTLSKTKPVILGGGTQMAAVCAVIKALGYGFEDIALATTKWIAEDKTSDITGLLASIDPTINAFYPDFDFADSEFANLRLYEQGFVKEGIGAGAVTVHAYLQGVSKDALCHGVEDIYRAFAG
ncbi:MAG: nicotinate mononucleotide-dependent phosphoribosyltransferase CobT [Campylobacterales bacterium]